MKTKIFKLRTVFLLLLPLCVVIMENGCEKEEYSEFVDGYVVGSFVCYEVGTDGVATGDYTERGYCILLKGSENADAHWPMDFYTFDLPPALFEFPEEVLLNPLDYDGRTCGPSFFPDSLQSVFKISFEYRDVKKTEEINFSCGPYSFMDLTFRWENYNQVSLRNLSKIN